MSLMEVEKVPDSTYDMIGGLDKQIREIKEMIELPIKHPKLFDALGVAQLKGVLLYGPLGIGKMLLAIPQTAHLSVYRVLSWCKTILVKAFAWSMSFSSWLVKYRRQSFLWMKSTPSHGRWWWW